jgi:phosphatidylglycerophosphate synthase
MTNKQVPILEPPFFSNWVDLVMPKIANKLLIPVAKIEVITPNSVTLISFALYLIASVSLFLQYPNHLLVAAILFPLSYIGDCLDGQLSRFTNRMSELGNYLDKTLDVLKIFILTISLSWAVYIQTNSPAVLLLGFIACFGFNFRYYIKLETVYSQFSNDNDYLSKSKVLRWELYQKLTEQYLLLAKTLKGRLKLIWLYNRSMFWLDEGEMVVFTALAALFNQLEYWLWILAIGQILIAGWRFFERSRQVSNRSKSLLLPMRK